MRRIIPAALAALAGFAAPGAADADFLWLEPWQVTTSAAARFGDVGADQATGSARVEVNTIVVPPIDRPSATIDFSRAFSLSGSPRGWDLESDVQGLGTYFHLHGEISLELTLDVDGRRLFHSLDQGLRAISGPVSFGLGFGFLPLSDGVHRLTGHLSLGADLPVPDITGPGIARVDLTSFTVSLKPRAIPEPASIALVASGIVLLAVGRAASDRRRRGGR